MAKIFLYTLSKESGDEIKFSAINDLIEQINNDIASARDYFTQGNT